MNLLRLYKRRRIFKETPEPRGKIKLKKGKKLIFVVHDHYARRHHHDLRLEHGGVLKSWAIPKLIPANKSEQLKKRLAVQTEDHPYEYKSFKGTIPEGHYGAGKVKIWDRGKYTPLEFQNNKIIFIAKGKKLNGDYCLIKFKGQDKNWLFFRKK